MPALVSTIVILLPIEYLYLHLNWTVTSRGLQFLNAQCKEYHFLRKMGSLDRIAETNSSHKSTPGVPGLLNIYLPQSAVPGRPLAGLEKFQGISLPRCYPKWLLPSFFNVDTFSRFGINILPRRLSEFYRAGRITGDEGVPVSELPSPLINLAGVKYLLTATSITVPELKLVLTGDEYLMFENTMALPRVFLVSRAERLPFPEILARLKTASNEELLRTAFVDESSEELGRLTGSAQQVITASAGSFLSNKGNVRITEYRDQYVRINCKIQEISLLVLTDTYFDGWSAHVKRGSVREEKRILPVDAAFRGVVLEPGEYVLEFTYSPRRNAISATVSAVSLATVITLLFALGGLRLRLDRSQKIR